ncbi:MAG: hypothetical protein FWD66_08270 [Paludibacter sp.]|nr:hypothetical protein [Paludibacter sp.]
MTAIFAFSACQKDDFSTDSNLKLQFSADTVSFDTVFTTIGTTTKMFKIYNRNNKSLRINNIYLENANSNFKINVDGSASASEQFTDIEILANDSIFVFVTAKIDPTNQNAPLIIDDKVVFSYNNNRQNVVLEAIGQDVHLLKNFEIINDTTFTADKPFLIYDDLQIAENATLTISAGVKMYFHNNAAIVAEGSVQALGTRLNPILMRGDRLDNIEFAGAGLPYNYVAGQWSGVYLFGEQTNNIFQNVRINSSDIGIFIYNENADPLQMPTLTIENCKLTNFSFYGLFVLNANVTTLNSEISNSGQYTLFLNGGTHLFVHTTIANFYGTNQNASRTDTYFAVLINDYENLSINGQQIPVAHSLTNFYNSIVMGDLKTEFELLTTDPTSYGGNFKNSYIRKNDIEDYPYFQNITWFKEGDIVFKNTDFVWNANEKSYYDFNLDSISPARNIGDIQYVTTNLQYDLNGNDRTTDGNPDAGAYEWVESNN